MIKRSRPRTNGTPGGIYSNDVSVLMNITILMVISFILITVSIPSNTSVALVCPKALDSAVINASPSDQGTADHVRGDPQQLKTLNSMVITADPSKPSIDEEFDLNIDVYFYGDCCNVSPVVYNVTPIADFPSEIKILSGPTPSIYEIVNVTFGVIPTIKSFVWRVKCDKGGSYALKITIKTDNSGNLTSQRTFNFGKANNTDSLGICSFLIAISIALFIVSFNARFVNDRYRIRTKGGKDENHGRRRS